MTKTTTFPSSKNISNNGIQFDVYNSEPETIKSDIASKNSKDCRIIHFMRNHITVILVFALGIVTGAIIVATIIHVNPITVHINSQRPNTLTEDNLNTRDTRVPIDPPNAVKTNSSNFKLISRQDWLAQPAVQPPNPLQTPVPYVIIHHTQTENCSSQAQCMFQVRYIQAFHIESRNWWDIGYNFLVGGDGEAYEGRGWKGEGAHTYGYNAKSIGIAFIGTFNSYKPPQIQITACKQLIAKGVELGYISKDYKLLAVKQLQTTKSPGDALYEEMKTWDHWAKGP